MSKKFELSPVQRSTMKYIIQWILNFVKEGILDLSDVLDIMVSIHNDFGNNE